MELCFDELQEPSFICYKMKMSAKQNKLRSLHFVLTSTRFTLDWSFVTYV